MMVDGSRVLLSFAGGGVFGNSFKERVRFLMLGRYFYFFGPKIML